MKKNVSSHIGRSFTRIHRFWQKRFTEIVREKGYRNLKLSFCSILYPLFEQDALTATYLAEYTGLTKQTISLYGKQLREKGYIKVSIDTNDNRKQRLFLTVKGRRLEEVFERTNELIAKEVCLHLSDRESLHLKTLLCQCEPIPRKIKKGNLPK